MFTVVILNGPHQGRVIHTPQHPGHEWRMPRLRHGSLADWSHQADLAALFHGYTSDIHVYRLTFTSVDGTMGLYTTDGHAERLFDSRDWVVKDTRLAHLAPLYIGPDPPEDDAALAGKETTWQ